MYEILAANLIWQITKILCFAVLTLAVNAHVCVSNR